MALCIFGAAAGSNEAMGVAIDGEPEQLPADSVSRLIITSQEALPGVKMRKDSNHGSTGRFSSYVAEGW
jgi:hypothetical protein